MSSGEPETQGNAKKELDKNKKTITIVLALQHEKGDDIFRLKYILGESKYFDWL